MFYTNPRQPALYSMPGSALLINLADPGGSLRATVDHVFPPTICDVLVATVSYQAPQTRCNLSVGSKFVLKIYDPRYTRRSEAEDSPEWSYSAERDAFPAHGGRLTRDIFGSSPSDTGCGSWEEYWFLRVAGVHDWEVQAYNHLKPLQGTGVPLMYGSGNLDLSEIDPRRTISPPVILMEYIEDAAPLHEVDPRVLSPPVIQSLLDTMHRLPDFGVCHDDLNPGNMLFAPANKPVRAVLIDFGDCAIRKPEQSDEDWEVEILTIRGKAAVMWQVGRRFSDEGLGPPKECQDWETVLR